MAITPDDKKISQFPEVTPSEGMFIPLIDLDQSDPSLRNVRATVAAILALVPVGVGTVTDFSSGNLSPLFTTSVATSTSTPALSFSLTSHSANQVFAGPTGGGSAAPTFRALVAADIPNLTSIYQPLDADLTAIAALGTTAYGRGFLTQADASAARTYIGAGTGSGTVTSVNLTQPAAGITVSGGPITTSGSITLALADDLAALEALSGTDTIYYRSGVSTWTPVTIGTNLLFSGGTLSASAPGTGTVTSFSAGNLSPLFTTNVATATTTPALTFSLSTQSANLVFAGPTNGAAAAPTFRSLVAADIPDLSATYQPLNANLTAISALTTTSYGLDFLELADAAAARAYIGAGTGSGTVTSVALTMPTGFSVAGSPITTSGTFAVTTTLSGIVVGDGSGLITRTATGTADRISITNGSGVAGNPTFDIAATYVGQTSITTLGTISTGTWSATTIAASRGGTGQTTYADGDLLYGLSGGLAKLAHPGLLNNILVTSFFGGLSWVDISVVATTTVTGTANQVLVNGGSGTGVTGAITLTLPQSIGTASNVQFGSINSTPIGNTTPSTGAFTTLATSGLVTFAEANAPAGSPSITLQGDTYNTARFGIYAAGPSDPVFMGRRAATSLASPTAVAGGVPLVGIAGAGYKDTGYSINAGAIFIRSDATFTDTSTPTRIDFEVTPTGSTSRSIAAVINSTGFQGAIGATTPSTGAFTTISGAVSTSAIDRVALLSNDANAADNGASLDFRLAGNAFQTAGFIRTRRIGASTTSAVEIGAASAWNTTPAVTVATFTSTGINSTAIGATTPSTGAFTTLSASSYSTAPFIAASGALASFPVSQGLYGYYSGGGVLAAYSDASGTAASMTYDGTSHVFRTGGVSRGSVTATGFQGAIGATTPSTGAFTTASTLSDGVALYVTGASGTAATYQRFQSTGGNYYVGISNSTGGGLIPGVGNYGFAIVAESNRNVGIGVNNTMVALFTSTGLNSTAIGVTTPDTVRGTKLIGGGTTPGVSVGAGAGSGASATISGSDAAVRVVLTTGTGASSGLLFTVTFASAFAAAPKVVFTPCESDSANLVLNCSPYVIRNTTIFEFQVVNPPNDGTDYPFDFVMIG